jgi:hypothetical protein
LKSWKDPKAQNQRINPQQGQTMLRIGVLSRMGLAEANQESKGKKAKDTRMLRYHWLGEGSLKDKFDIPKGIL